jgi:gamma-glutamylcyclotransferase (GGCT)/AIG2-like uncharacterized protein YtfP
MAQEARRTLLRVFVYGTLKRGHENHRRLCAGMISAVSATVGGRLYDLPYGYPALVIPGENVLAAGTANSAEDARKTGPRTEAWGLPRDARPPEGWDVVHGELLTFDDPERRLPALDLLEGFDPRSPGLYRRVLLPVETGPRQSGMVAWAYIVQRLFGAYLPEGRWPP